MLVNKSRFKENLFHIGKIGENENGGIDRIAFSESYYAAADELKNLMVKAKMDVKIDKIGNIIAKKKGENNSLPSIIIGSHLDTVPNGGLFDGNLGVIAGLECVNILNDNNIKTEHPIEIIAFNAEEGSDMGGTFGSRAMMGNVNLKDNKLKENLKKYDLKTEDLKEVKRDKGSIASYLELHIEQGLNLIDNNFQIGIVDKIAGIMRYKITVWGESDHAGTTSMLNRKDALTGAVKLINLIEKYAHEVGEPFVATIGDLKVFPGAVNVIPEKVELLLEFRDAKQDRIEDALKQTKKFTQKIKNIKFEFDKIVIKPPIQLDKNIINILQRSCNNMDTDYMNLTSGAGHDAKVMAKSIPTGMIFVPSVEGKSHCRDEWTELKDCYKGTEVLYSSVLAIDNNI
ncbi:MAG TPA: M20 family metallo-hydrolase [Halanaerobiales bacterium]|nr:M20 family metallo-hydrolase [Halanaerobiales bacterium]